MNQRVSIRAASIAAAFASLAAAPSLAHAQWTVTRLSPGSESQALCGYGNRQGGYAVIDGTPTAVIWNADGSTTLLNPNGADDAAVWGMSATQQVGAASLPFPLIMPTLWTGTADSWRSLLPGDYSRSWAWATDGTQQVGTTVSGSSSFAALWTGTAASWVSLHPATALESDARAVANGQQVGWMLGAGGYRAVRWSGTAGSMMPLHPGQPGNSHALATTGTQQAGWVESGGVRRAGTWSNTPTSWQAMHPIDASSSEAHATIGTHQAGVVGFEFSSQAAVWRSTAASCELLPFPPVGSWESSAARSISLVNNTLYVAGFAYNATDGRNEALLWKRLIGCGIGDLAGPGQTPGADNQLTADDIIIFIQFFFASDARADIAGPGQTIGADGQFTADDIIVFIAAFFAGC